MDKILRRVHMAERQVARRTKRQKELRHGLEKVKKRQEVARMTRQAGFEINQAIKARHEDLELGPLAPRREIARVDKFGNYWGTISSERIFLRNQLSKEEKEARAAWAGGSKHLCLTVGDRVVVTEGPYKGKIANITMLNKDAMVAELDNNVGIVSQHVTGGPASTGSHAHTLRNRST
jgi:large subunit ribosomal protein L24